MTRTSTEPRPRRGAFLRVAMTAALALLAFGCAALSPTPQQQTATTGSASKIAPDLERLSARARGLQSVQSSAVMEYRSADQHIKAREQVVLLVPASLRVDAMSPFGVALIVVARDQTLQIFDPSSNHLVSDAATAEALNRYVRIPMEPRDAVRLLMGLAPAGMPLDKPADSVGDEGAMTVASWNVPGAGLHELGFSGDALAMVRQRDSRGAVQYEVRYSDYHDIGGVQFPYVVDADFPIAKSHVTLRYDRPIINGDIPSSVFVLTPRPGPSQAEVPPAHSRPMS